jgi:hypothetical protein
MCRFACVWVLALATGTLGQGCAPDSSCNAHRACEFGSIAGYESTYRHILAITGCSPACVNQCACTSCNTSGDVYDALSADPVTYCQNNIICQDAQVKRALNFPATQFECDAVFSIALTSLYQLCGTTNGQCRNGQCDNEDCISTVANACDQQTGLDRATSFIVSLYAATMVTLFIWAYASLTHDVEVEEAKEFEPPPQYSAITKEKIDIDIM